MNAVRPHAGPAPSPGPSRNENPLGGDSLSVDFKLVFASVVDLLKGVFTPHPASLEREAAQDQSTKDLSSQNHSGKTRDASRDRPGEVEQGKEGNLRKDRLTDDGPLRKIQEEVRRAANQLSRNEGKVTEKTVRQMVAQVKNPDAEAPLPVRADIAATGDSMKSLPQNGAESGQQGKTPLPQPEILATGKPGVQLPLVTASDVPELPPAVAKGNGTDVPLPPVQTTPSTTLPMAQMASMEVPVKEPVPVRTEGGNRVFTSGDLRKADGLSSAARASRSQPAPLDTERVEFVERLMKAARVTRFRGQSRLRMILSPPRLGSVKVDLVMKDQVMHGKLTTESIAAREAVQSQLNMLKDQLQSHGIEVGELDVCVDSGSNGARPDADANPAKLSDRESKEARDFTGTEASPDTPAPVRLNDDQMIDLVA